MLQVLKRDLSNKQQCLLFVDEVKATYFNINFHFIECIELHLNITPFEGYPQGTDQGQGAPNNHSPGKSKKN